MGETDTRISPKRDLRWKSGTELRTQMRKCLQAVSDILKSDRLQNLQLGAQSPPQDQHQAGLRDPGPRELPPVWKLTKGGGPESQNMRGK